MTSSIIHTQDTRVGKIVISRNEDGCWLELDHGEESMGMQVTRDDLEGLRCGITQNDDKIRAAESGTVEGRASS